MGLASSVRVARWGQCESGVSATGSGGQSFLINRRRGKDSLGRITTPIGYGIKFNFSNFFSCRVEKSKVYESASK
jgi:hypothetical protein